MQMIVSGSENQSQLDLIGTQYEMLDFEVAKYLDILSVTTLSTVSAILRAILDQQVTHTFHTRSSIDQTLGEFPFMSRCFCDLWPEGEKGT